RYFFFRAEDGIRDKLVTGVQTCALPIFAQSLSRFIEFRQVNATDGFDLTSFDHIFPVPLTRNVPMKGLPLNTSWTLTGPTHETEIGRASLGKERGRRPGPARSHPRLCPL